MKQLEDISTLDLFADTEPTPVVIGLKECQEVAAKVHKRFGVEESTALLQRFALARLKDIDQAQMKPFHEFAAACISRNYPPSGSWANENVPTYAGAT